MLRRLTPCHVALLLFASWAHASAAQTSPPASAKKVPTNTVTITGQDNGKDIDLSTGATLIVELKSNPSTGYTWTVAGDPAPLKLEKSKYHKNTKSQAVGAPGSQVLRLSAGSAGIVNLTVVYRRSWEYNAPPAKTFSVRVNVR